MLTTPSANSTTSSTSNTSSGSASTSSSAGNSAAGPFKVNYNNLTVGYNGGLWNIGFTDVSGKKVSVLTVTLHTPVESVLCTGFLGKMQFSNCISGPNKTYLGTPDPNGPFPANATFTGFTSGVGPGSAKAGQTYSVVITASFSDGTSVNQTSTVQAISGA